MMAGDVRLPHLNRKNADSNFEFIAMELLHQHIAPGAFHNSDERYDPPKCHPHTRRAVLKKIMDWVKDPNKVALFLWLYGPAGAGKSAIVQTIAELLEKLGLLAAAFFFSRNAAGRNNKTRLVATLVYQLLKSIPEIRAHVLAAVEQDPALFSCSIDTQIQALIVKPLNAAANEEALAPILLSRPRLIILDGLDECSTASSQTQILNALSTATKDLHIPLFFLIASRPEQDIRQSFNDQNGLGSLSFSIALDDTYRPDDDIRVFLQSTFDEIKRNHPSRAHLPTSWPSLEDIRQLVGKSSGQFIFASTVAKYVNSRHHWPPDRLNIIFGKSEPSQETPFAELDSLYHLILSSVADAEKLQDVLRFLVFQPFWQCVIRVKQTMTSIEKFLFYRPGEIDMILTDLHSIVNIPLRGDEFSEVRFFHASLRDFLLDRSRSMDLFLDQGAAYAKLTRLAMKHIKNPTKSPLRDYQSMSFPSCCGFVDSIKMKRVFIVHFGGVVSTLIHPRSSLRTCAG
jgi:hypothetical protein